VEAIYVRVRQLGPQRNYRLLLRVVVVVLVIRRLSHVSVHLPRGRRGGGGRGEAHEAHGDHDGLKLFVSHNGIECSSVP